MPLLEIHTHPLRAIWHITEETEQLLALLERKELYLPFLTQTTSVRRKQEWLAARLLLKELIGREVTIDYQANGAPFIADSSYGLSISHSRNYVALLLQPNAAAGIDIEYRSDRALRLKERILAPEELAALDRQDPLTHSLLHWSAKEVLFKLIGQENVDFRQHLHIAPFSLAEEGCFTASETRTENGASFELHYQVTPSYVWVWNSGIDMP